MSAASVHDRLVIGTRAELVRILADSKTRTATSGRFRFAALTPVDLNALLIFAKVAEANSFSEAARRLRIPISTVSRQVTDLEAQLGIRLLERSTRRLRMTDIGAEVLEQARVVTDVRENIIGLISSQSSNVSGLLKLAVPPSIANDLIMPVVAAFQASYPDVRVDVTISERSAELSTSDFDLLVTVGPIKDSSQITRKILTFRHCLVASSTYLMNRKVPETPRELPDHRLLALSSGTRKIEWSFTENDHRNGITLTIEPYLSVNDPTSLAEAILSGMGIGNLPSTAVGDLVQQGRLVELMPQWPFRTLDVSVIHASSRHVRRPVQEFIRLAAKLAPTLFPACQSSIEPSTIGMTHRNSMP